MELSGARVLVIGLARSGIAAIKLLREQGATVTACDTKPFDNVEGARFLLQSEDAARGHDLVVISPGVPVDAAPLEWARAHGIPVTGEMEMASHFLAGPVLAVTGSNGKTTATALCHHILRECGIASQVGGNIGVPLSAMVESSRPDQWNVLEVSSFQAETMERFRARIAVCLNITPDHLDRHRTMEVYIAAKRRLFELQDSDGLAVLNADDPVCGAFVPPDRGVRFSLKPRASGYWHGGGVLYAEGKPFLRVDQIPLRGMHNVENVLAAAAATHLAGAPLDGIARAVGCFPGVEHRIEYVRTVSGVQYFNDSKATNVDAALKALDAFPGGLWVILGGKDKGSDYQPLRAPLEAKARAALLVGAAGPKIGLEIAGAVPLVVSGDIARAVEHARKNASRGDVVLLAPACASFDQFDNYEHRGRVFKDLVRAIPEES
ncbi:MAG: UDP-N-acetylmuramoyl-L-alanine--D-glutamate ligase [Acidobacteria bacterium]|nr:UDP-N-acetylmuramoyl-L-alanine--D-glutamate ligase [Acidobacteriota bacterium]